jgi:hypothetical protein
MPPDFLDPQRVAYLRRRAALGFQMRAEQLRRPEFVAYGKAQGRTGPVPAQWVLEGACQATSRRGPGGAARRRRSARQLLADLRAAAPDTAVPDPRRLPSPRRPNPYRFTPRPLTALFEAAPARRRRGS